MIATRIRAKTDSSFISRVVYENSTLRIAIGYRVYVYYNVPYGVFSEMLGSDSAGKYFNKYIKPYYKCERVE